MTISLGCWRVGPPNWSMESCAESFLGRATGTKNSLGRRRVSIFPVTLPSTSITKWRAGSTNGELMIGSSIVA